MAIFLRMMSTGSDSIVRKRLTDRFPIQVVTAWIGNSVAVAKKHYLQVTDNHFDAAAGGANMVQNLSGGANMVQNSQAPKSKNPAKSEVSKSAKALKSKQAPPVGLEPTTNGLTVRCSTN